MKTIITLAFLLATIAINGQSAMTYAVNDSTSHLCGPIEIADMQSGKYQEWFDKNYTAIELSDKKTKWRKNLKDTSVYIYLGTWCGDSRRWVPKFVKLWDELGLDRDQLNFIALYNGERTKQGPNGEETGKGIHRVPTFIFHEDDEEYARIVEKPITDLETDLAQIALGYPVQPRYAAANYMLNLFEEHSIEAINKDYRIHINAAYRLVSKSSEMNTLGYVLLAADKVDEALIVLQYNTRFFPKDPNVYDSYGEVLAISGDVTEAIVNYEKTVALEPDNEHAIAQIKKLKEGL